MDFDYSLQGFGQDPKGQGSQGSQNDDAKDDTKEEKVDNFQIDFGEDTKELVEKSEISDNFDLGLDDVNPEEKPVVSTNSLDLGLSDLSLDEESSEIKQDESLNDSLELDLESSESVATKEENATSFDIGDYALDNEHTFVESVKAQEAEDKEMEILASKEPEIPAEELDKQEMEDIESNLLSSTFNNEDSTEDALQTELSEENNIDVLNNSEESESSEMFNLGLDDVTPEEEAIETIEVPDINLGDSDVISKEESNESVSNLEENDQPAITFSDADFQTDDSLSDPTLDPVAIGVPTLDIVKQNDFEGITDQSSEDEKEFNVSLFEQEQKQEEPQEETKKIADIALEEPKKKEKKSFGGLFGIFKKKSKDASVSIDSRDSQIPGENNFVLGGESLDSQPNSEEKIQEVEVNVPTQVVIESAQEPLQIPQAELPSVELSVNEPIVQEVSAQQAQPVVENVEEAAPMGRFSLGGEAKEVEKKEAPAKNGSFSFGTIKLDVDTGEKQKKTDSSNTFQNAGTLFAAKAKDDSAGDEPVINILSEIAKNGITVEGDLDTSVETELFKQVHKKKKMQQLIKTFSFGLLGLVIVGGIGGGIFVGTQNKAFMASILSPKGSDLSQNAPAGNNQAGDKDKQITDLQNQISQLKSVAPAQNPKPIDSMEMQKLQKELVAKQSEIDALKSAPAKPPVDDGMKKKYEELKKQLEEKNKAFAKLSATKDASQITGAEVLSKEQLDTAILEQFYDFYAQDYNYVNTSKLPESSKKVLLMKLNETILDFKAGKMDYSQFRMKYNRIIDLALQKNK